MNIIYAMVSLIAQLVKNQPAMQRPQFDSWVGEICWSRNKLPIPVFLGFPCGSAGKESTCNAGDLGSIPGLGISPGEGNRYPSQYSGLENSKSQIRPSNFHFHGDFRHTSLFQHFLFLLAFKNISNDNINKVLIKLSPFLSFPLFS